MHAWGACTNETSSFARGLCAPEPSSLSLPCERLSSTTQSSPPTDTKRTRGFATVALVALAARALYLAQVASAPLFDVLLMDGASYVSWAQRIAAGDWIGSEVFYQAPLYPYFLAALQVVFGDGLWPIRVAQALLGSLSCGLLYLATRSFFSQRAALLAGITLALSPPAIFFDGLIQKASLGGVLVTALLALIGRARHSPSPKVWLAAGATLGALMATREETILLVPVLLGACWTFTRRVERSARLRSFAATLGGLALVLAPIAARNAHVGGEFVLTTAQAGPNFYIGNHKGATGVYEPLRPGRSSTPLERIDAKELAELDAGRPLSAAEVSRHWLAKSITWISSDPVAWASLLARKFALALNAYEIPDYEDQAYYAEHSSLLRGLGWLLHLGVVAPLAAAGMMLTWARRRELAVLHALIGALIAGCVLFYVFGRYRYPLAPLLILFAAAGAVHAHELWRDGNRSKLVRAAVVAVVTAVLCNWPLIDARAQLAMTYSNAGAALIDAGKPAEALAQLRRSVELADDADSRANLSTALLAQGEAREALTHARRAVELRPNDPLLLRGLGQALAASGDESGAIETLKRAIQGWPRAPESWEALVNVFVSRGDWPRAIETARSALRYNGDEISTGLQLAWLLSVSEDEALRNPPEAVQIAQALEARTKGQDLRVLEVLGVALASAGRAPEAQDMFEEAARRADEAGQGDLADRIRASAAALRTPSLR